MAHALLRIVLYAELELDLPDLILLRIGKVGSLLSIQGDAPGEAFN